MTQIKKHRQSALGTSSALHAALATGAILSVLTWPAYSQTANGQPSFEVASIKPAAPPSAGPGGRIMVMMGSRGGPGSNDPGRYQCNNCNLQMLMVQAYGVDPYQLSIPSAMDNERFEVTAKVPEGATQDQFKLMLQNLLAERFNLKIHREAKEGQIYELTVAKGGSKMKESAPPEPPKEAALDTPPSGPPPLPMITGPGQIKMDKDGFPIMPKGAGGGRGGPMTIRMPGKARMQMEQESMADFANVLARQLAKPVTDLTGLKGKYDFTLTWDGANMGGPGIGPGRGAGVQFAMSVGGPGPAPAGGGGGGGGASDGSTPLGEGSDKESAPTIFGAVQSQLGLKLEAKKGQVESIIVDHVEKVPTEN